MINIITEGQVIPNGFSIKVGFCHQFAEYPNRYITQGRDGLVESVLYDWLPLTHDDTRPWATLIYNCRWFRVSYRIRSWAPTLFRFEWADADHE